MTVAAIPLVMATAGTLTSAIGQIQEGQQAAASLGYRSQVMRNEAMIARRNSNLALEDSERAYEDAAEQGFKYRQDAMDQDLEAVNQIAGEQRVFLASGLLDDSSPLHSMRRLAARDRSRTVLAGERASGQLRTRAYGLEVEAGDLLDSARAREADARVSDISASSARTSGFVRAAGTLIGGAGQIGSSILTDMNNPNGSVYFPKRGSNVWLPRGMGRGRN